MDSAIKAADIIREVKRAGIHFIVALPDRVTSERLLKPMLADPEFRVVQVCKEDEGMSICSGLYAAGRSHADVALPEFKAQITAGVLLFRALTYGIQIPLGAFTYIVWRRNKRWRKEPPPEPSPAAASVEVAT